VLLPHRAVVATTLSLARFLEEHGVPLDHRDVYLSFLPLAHVFDRQPAACMGHCSVMHECAWGDSNLCLLAWLLL
jgi:long-subunit acyl-CoA synthetase (AMP-forming)